MSKVKNLFSPIMFQRVRWTDKTLDHQEQRVWPDVWPTRGQDLGAGVQQCRDTCGLWGRGLQHHHVEGGVFLFLDFLLFIWPLERPQEAVQEGDGKIRSSTHWKSWGSPKPAGGTTPRTDQAGANCQSLQPLCIRLWCLLMLIDWTWLLCGQG